MVDNLSDLPVEIIYGICCYISFLDIVRLSQVNVDFLNICQTEPFHQLLKDKFYKVCQNKGIITLLNLNDNFGQALIKATKSNNLEQVKLLLKLINSKKAANLLDYPQIFVRPPTICSPAVITSLSNVRPGPTTDKTVALMEASMRGYLSIVKELIKGGAKVNGGGNLSLDKAIRNGRLDVIEYLVQSGANLEDISRNTLRSVRRRKRVVDLLVIYGIDRQMFM